MMIILTQFILLWPEKEPPEDSYNDEFYKYWYQKRGLKHLDNKREKANKTAKVEMPIAAVPVKRETL